jgi:hypothetical protein
MIFAVVLIGGAEGVQTFIMNASDMNADRPEAND